MPLYKTNQAKSQTLKIGAFNFDPVTGTLSAGERRVRLEPQTATFLMVLAESPNEIVTRDALLAEVWENRPVSDDAIRAVVKKLRVAMGDDARNATYIKTVPMKGYQLIAPVSQEESSSARERSSRRSLGLFAAAILIAVLALTALYFFRDPAAVTERQAPQVTYLTALKGSELGADYNPATNRLVFSHRDTNESPLQLLVADLTAGKTQRLTWDTANYANAFWAPNGESMVYTLSSTEGITHYYAQYSATDGLVSARPLDQDVLANKFLLGWSADNRTIYLKDGYKKDSSQGIFRFALNTKELQPVTSPSVAGIGDFFAKESHDGERLAILRAQDTNKNELLVLDLSTGALVLNRVIPFAANKLVWAQDNGALILSGFKGGFYRYDISVDQFSKLAVELEHSNDVLFHCGNGCIFARQHNGNYLDIEEHPNPFHPAKLVTTDYIENLGADDLPVYSASGDALYFVSLTSEGLSLMRQTRQSSPEEIVRLPEEGVLGSLQVNASQTAIAGLVGNRVFVFDFDSGQIAYVTSGVEHASNPVWGQGETVLLYSLFEKGAHGIYAHDLESGTRVKAMEGYLALRQLDGEKRLVIDDKLTAWLRLPESPPKKIATLQSANPNRWQVVDDKLFYMTRNGTDSYLHYQSLLTGKSDKRRIGKNQFRLNFDVHPSGKKVSIVKSLLAESNIVKISTQQ